MERCHQQRDHAEVLHPGVYVLYLQEGCVYEVAKIWRFTASHPHIVTHMTFRDYFKLNISLSVPEGAAHSEHWKKITVR